MNVLLCHARLILIILIVAHELWVKFGVTVIHPYLTIISLVKNLVEYQVFLYLHTLSTIQR